MKTQENIINNDINQISAESLALLNSIDYEKPLRADDFKNIANNYEYWLANTSAEKRAKVREQMTETQKGKKSNVLGILEKLLENPNYVFTEDEKAIYIECEGSDEPLLLNDLIDSFNGAEVTISVRESIDVV